MDPVTNAVVHSVASESARVLKKESDGFLKAVLGEPAKALGGLIADKINKRRHANLIKICVEAKRALADAGVLPKEVPLNVIHPALEAASLAEEPDLQGVWANLLANAADPRQANPVAPSFPHLLRELGVREVKFLDDLYRNSIGVVKLRQVPEYLSFTIQDVQYRRDELLEAYARLGLSRNQHLVSMTVKYYQDNRSDIDADLQDFGLTLDIIKRSGILAEAADTVPVHVSADHLDTLSALKVDLSQTYFFSHLGACFVAACRKPESGGRLS